MEWSHVDQNRATTNRIRSVSPPTIQRTWRIARAVIAGSRRAPQAVQRLRKSLRGWLDTPVAIGAPTAPSTIYRAFISEKTSQAAPLTVKFYKAKPVPFAVWCEHQGLAHVEAITRTDVSMFLGYIRKGQRKALSNGALKLHHQSCEPPRESWRLQSLRGRSGDKINQISGGAARAGGKAGAGKPQPVLLGVGGDHLDHSEVRHVR